MNAFGQFWRLASLCSFDIIYVTIMLTLLWVYSIRHLHGENLID